MASTYLERTISTTGNRKTWTWSSWVKRSGLKASGSMYVWSENNAPLYSTLMFTDDAIRYYDYNNAFLTQIKTNKVFRDTSAWYHIVITYDSTQSTASDRIKFYINGVQETSMATSSYPSLNFDSNTNISGQTFQIGTETSGTPFDGSMSHIHFIDGTAYDASAFGENDANGVWKIKTDVSVTYGTNGFFILKDGNSVTDQSGNGNNFTVAGGTLTNTEDSPSNVFATWNPLQWTYDGVGNPPNTSFGNGNTSVLTSASSGDSSNVWGTLGASAGKYYYEIKMTNNPSDAGNTNMGVGWGNVETGERIAYYSGNGYEYYSSGSAPYGATYTQNDIIGVAVDLTNGTIEFYKNGVSQGSITNRITTNTGFWQPLSWDGSGSLTASWDANFGNGYFGTTAVASAGTNASGIGIFEYDVPTGYTALSTKGLNT